MTARATASASYYDLQASPEGFLSQAGSVGIELAF